MKFKDVKKGDTVYWMKKIHSSTDVSAWFWVPAKVVKVTPKRFVVEFKRDKYFPDTKTYRKKDGRQVGDFYTVGQEYVYYLGDVANDQNIKGLTVTDDTADIEPFKKRWESDRGRKALAIRDLSAALLKLNLNELHDKPEGELNLLLTALKQIVGPLEKER